jgi:hypothetical protein
VCNPTQVDLVAIPEVVFSNVHQDEVPTGGRNQRRDAGYSEDSGENLEAVELRRHARKFKKRMRDKRVGLELMQTLLF